MTAFRFVAVRRDGGRVRGRMDAERDTDVAAQLTRRGLLPVAVEPVPERAPWPWQRPSPMELAVAFRGLASLVAAGVPLASALETAQRLARGPLEQVLARVRSRVSEGVSLGAALAVERSHVPAVTIGLVRAGESGVGLAAGLDAAAQELERDAETRSSVKAALAYPAILLVTGGVSLIAILGVVVPRFAEVLGDMTTALPLSTRALLGSATVLRRHGAALGVGAVLVTGGVATLVRSRRSSWHTWLLGLPVVGGMRLRLATVRVARILARLHETGTPATTSLEVAARTVGDAEVARRLRKASERVAQGAPVSRALADERALTPLSLSLAAVGDGTGQVGRLLGRAADIEDLALRQQLRTTVQLIEPILIVIFAGFVAVVALALLQAVYSVRPGAL